MEFILFGIGLGFVSLLAPGPINLGLVHVGARLGRRHALHGSAGVIGGDALLGIIALLVVIVGATSLPANVFVLTQLVAALIMVAVGVGLAVKPAAVGARLDQIQRPGLAFFILTSCTPTALGSWIAMLGAMPFASDPFALSLFATGVVAASCIWHPVLGLASATLAARMDDAGQQRLARAGGISMAALGAVLLVNQLLQ